MLQPDSFPLANDADQLTGDGPAIDPKLAEFIWSLWLESRERITEEIASLEAVATAWLAGRLLPERRELAAQTAHTLAGMLGTYGFPEGSRLAVEIELALRAGEDPGLKQLLELQSATRALVREIERVGGADGAGAAGPGNIQP